MSKRRILLIIIVGVLVALIGGGALFVFRLLNPAETVTLAQINRDIAFMSNRDNGQWGIYIITPEGDIRRVTPLAEASDDPCTPRNLGRGHCAADYFPSYAFDGQMLNFLSNRHEVELGPAQARPDGSDFRILDVLGAIASVALDQRFDWDPQWSSTGQIGWSKVADLNLEIYIADADGGNEQRLTRDGFNGPRDWFLSWSADGESITYNSDRNGGVENIYRVDVADITPGDFTPVQLTDNPVDDFRATWALDGESILFISDSDDGLLNTRVQLFLMDTDGGNMRPLDDALFAGGAVYSADGSQMVYISNESGTWSLYLMDVATGDTVQLTDDTGDDLFPVWEPVPAEEES